ncbi:MAG: hypothetical protein HFG85_10095, partial [Dorea sp.]|nr:hypothetical protein [Dorea sp.]
IQGLKAAQRNAIFEMLLKEEKIIEVKVEEIGEQTDLEDAAGDIRTEDQECRIAAGVQYVLPGSFYLE